MIANDDLRKRMTIRLHEKSISNAASVRDGFAEKLRHFRACQEGSFKTSFSRKCAVAALFPWREKVPVVLSEIVAQLAAQHGVS